MKLLALSQLLALTALSLAYKPVFMMHGVSSDYKEMLTIKAMLNNRSTVATSLDLYNGEVESLVPLQLQVDGIIREIRALVAANRTLYKGGFHFCCKSQGGMTCRTVIEQLGLNFEGTAGVDTFVSLAGPQAGVYGPDFFKSLKVKLFENVTASEAWRVAYTPKGQLLSVGNLWHDSFKHQSLYLHSDKFQAGFTENATARMKASFLQLKKAVFCVGSWPGNGYDGGIEPWQSGVWGSLDEHGTMQNMTEQGFYVRDSFGLRTLDESGRLQLVIVPNATHADWTSDHQIIAQHVLPWLT